ncbi:hypothetical protein E2C01_018257 [Portunus trituberculatus]|uniref:Uncharacterized protein n=1 Tax=Portunus trituberculatus TaxID=210409 RepID=A0A5B7DV19_PORTR|nr:hypothetical protein [Portunus trituberculatus]
MGLDGQRRSLQSVPDLPPTLKRRRCVPELLPLAAHLALRERHVRLPADPLMAERDILACELRRSEGKQILCSEQDSDTVSPDYMPTRPFHSSTTNQNEMYQKKIVFFITKYHKSNSPTAVTAQNFDCYCCGEYSVSTLVTAAQSNLLKLLY